MKTVAENLKKSTPIGVKKHIAKNKRVDVVFNTKMRAAFMDAIAPLNDQKRGKP
jgi:hypothetical protein